MLGKRFGAASRVHSVQDQDFRIKLRESTGQLYGSEHDRQEIPGDDDQERIGVQFGSRKARRGEKGERRAEEWLNTCRV